MKTGWVRKGVSRTSCGRNRVGGSAVEAIPVGRGEAERLERVVEVFARRHLGQRDPDPVLAVGEHVQPKLTGGAAHRVGSPWHPDAQGVEEGVVLDLDPAVAQRGGQHGCVAVRAFGDPGQPGGTVVDGVHRGGDSQQHLCRADVGRRLVAADVLLAGLEGEPVRRTAFRVDGDADQAAGQVTLEAC